MSSTILLSDNGVSSGSSGYKITAGTDGVLILQTTTSGGTATNAIYVDNNQNVGVGVTPSAFNSVVKALQINNGTFQGSTNSSQFTLNAYFNGTNYTIDTARGAMQYIQDQGAGHSWGIASSGASAFTFTQAMTLDASGNLIVGGTSVGYTARFSQFVKDGTTASNSSVTDSAVLASRGDGASGETVALRVKSGTGISGTAYAGQLISAGNNIFEVYTAGNAPLVFGTNSTERARIDSSGNLMLGTTGQLGTGLLSVYRGNTTNYCATFRNDYAGTRSFIEFYATASSVGSITSNGTTTTYGTSSDYRLKENVQPMTGALATVAQLKPCTYTWKSDGSEGQGFIAHELQAVLPDAVVGEKDATRIEQYEISPAVPATFDEEGNELTPAVEAVMGEHEVPAYQGIDTSFLVATLTAAIQEQQALITTLTERITALEGAKA